MKIHFYKWVPRGYQGVFINIITYISYILLLIYMPNEMFNVITTMFNCTNKITYIILLCLMIMIKDMFFPQLHFLFLVYISYFWRETMIFRKSWCSMIRTVNLIWITSEVFIESFCLTSRAVAEVNYKQYCVEPRPSGVGPYLQVL